MAVDAAHRPTIAYISWAPHCSRSDHTARELGGRSHSSRAPTVSGPQFPEVSGPDPLMATCPER